ncbi:hypothetical protein DXE05_25005 [Vibrio parahaemolyticus]|nr:hypothetical protein DXE05_25005 [Vibrio parahaemolyticus]
MPRGGARSGAGRKKSAISTKPIRVPSDIYYFVKILSRAVREEPDNYGHLFDSDRARYMLACLSSDSPIEISRSSARFSKRKKKK